MRYVLALLMLLSARPVLAVNLGDTVDSLTFKDTWYLPRKLEDLGEAKAYVLVFVREGCAAVEKATDTVRALEAAYGSKGVAFAAIDSADADSPMQAAWFALGVTETPEAILLDARHTLRYRGRVEDLAAAMDAVLAGSAPAAAETAVEGCALSFEPLPTPSDAVTYAKDIAPMMQAHCVACHRPNGQAPFDLSTFDAVAAHANMVAEVVREGRMPPWYAHPDYVKFKNDRHVSPEQVTALRQWIAGGKAQGDLPLTASSQVPESRPGSDDGWQVEPDLILEPASRSAVPATGFVPYQYVFLPHVFEDDCYIEGIEIKPDNPRVLHHGNLCRAHWQPLGFQRRDHKQRRQKDCGGLRKDDPEAVHEGRQFIMFRL